MRRPRAPIGMIGISAGSGLLVRFLGRKNRVPPQVFGGVGISPGYDISKCFTRVHWAYDRFLTKELKHFFVKRHLHRWDITDAEHLSASERKRREGVREAVRRTLQSRSIDEFMSHSGPLQGCASYQEMIETQNPVLSTQKVEVPCLMLNALDDPVCVATNIHENTHLFHNCQSPSVLAVTPRGSHACFYEGLLAQRKWSNRVALEFLESSLVQCGLAQS